MKDNKTIFGKVVAAAAAVLASASVALATGYPASLNITNMLSGTNVITSYPTNSIGTNGMAQQTGRAVYIGNVRAFQFKVEGFLVNTGAATTVAFQLLSSTVGSQPQVTTGTNLLSVNQTVLTLNNFDDSSLAYSLVVPIPANTTNWYSWSTNFDGAGYRFLNANWIGLYSISNNIATGNQWTNVAAYVNTKLIPTPLIGQ